LPKHTSILCTINLLIVVLSTNALTTQNFTVLNLIDLEITQTSAITLSLQLADPDATVTGEIMYRISLLDEYDNILYDKTNYFYTFELYATLLPAGKYTIRASGNSDIIQYLINYTIIPTNLFHTIEQPSIILQQFETTTLAYYYQLQLDTKSRVELSNQNNYINMKLFDQNANVIVDETNAFITDLNPAQYFVIATPRNWEINDPPVENQFSIDITSIYTPQVESDRDIEILNVSFPVITSILAIIPIIFKAKKRTISNYNI